MQYFLQYVLGLDNPAGIAASKGNVVHKALECIALYKKALQDNHSYILENNLGRFDLEECLPENFIQRSFDWHYKHFNHNWNYKNDLKECTKWMHMALDFQGGLFDPRKRTIVDAEKRFDFELPYEWARYEYDLPDGKKLHGQLAIKGTIDLVTEIKSGILEVIDWKTGRNRSDFATGKVKDDDSLLHDLQLRLYHYAAHLLYTQAKDILTTVFYIQAGGPFTIPLGDEDFEETEEMLKRQFERIRHITRPALNPGPPWSTKPNKKLSDFKCMRFCVFSGPSPHDPSKTICQFFRDKIKELSMKEVVDQYADLSKISSYQDGGGKYV